MICNTIVTCAGVIPAQHENDYDIYEVCQHGVGMYNTIYKHKEMVSLSS